MTTVTVQVNHKITASKEFANNRVLFKAIAYYKSVWTATVNLANIPKIAFTI
jgi:hypothetical protein